MKIVTIAISVYLNYYKGLFFYLLGSKNKLSLSVDTMLNNFSFRADITLTSFRFFGSTLKNTFKKIWHKEDSYAVQVESVDSRMAVIYGHHKFKKLIKDDYLNELHKWNINLFIRYDGIYLSASVFVKILLSFIVILNLPLQLLFFLFVKNKRNFFYASFELIEIIILTGILKNKKIDSVITFSSYEKSSNFLACILQSNKIQLTKVCSPNPLKYHYQKVVCNTFVCTAPYQLEEYEKHKTNWYIDKIDLWPVYEFKKYKEHYLKFKDKEQHSALIGFYSSGYGARNAQGNRTLDEHLYQAEIKTIHLLSKFINAHAEFSLKIYLHPVEKKNEEQYEKSKMYYRKLFGEKSEKLIFNEINEVTWEDFENLNTSVAIISSMNFERLYSGYKAIYSQIGFEKSNFEDTALDKITALNEDDFNHKLLNTLSLSKKEFFTRSGLTDYVFYGF